MEQFTAIVSAIAGLYKVAGPGVASVAIGGVVLVTFWRWRHTVTKDDLWRELLDDKEKQIQRLADDNRQLREYLLASKGLPEPVIQRIMAMPVAEPLPGSGIGKPRKKRKKD